MQIDEYKSNIKGCSLLIRQLQKSQQSRFRPGFVNDVSVQLHYQLPGLDCPLLLQLLWLIDPSVNEVTSQTVGTEAFLDEGTADLGFVPGVELLILAQFVTAVCELALLVVWTIAHLHKGFTKFRLLFVETVPVLGRFAL